MPRIGRETENEELCQILSGKEDSFLTILKITRALCNYTNDILDDNKIASKILGLGYKEDIEENRQMIQTLLNVNQKKSDIIRGTPYPSKENVNQ